MKSGIRLLHSYCASLMARTDGTEVGRRYNGVVWRIEPQGWSKRFCITQRYENRRTAFQISNLTWEEAKYIYTILRYKHGGTDWSLLDVNQKVVEILGHVPYYWAHKVPYVHHKNVAAS